jgi:alkylation response protein AidB-like acyl-CoA dehydrogenase
MSKSQPSEQELLQTILQPLLVDFEYWFGRSKELLEREPIAFLRPNAQTELLARVDRAQQEVSVAKMLFNAVGGQAGIEASQMVGWHQIVTECWHVSMQLRQSEQSKIEE